MRSLFVTIMAVAVAASAADFQPREFNVYGGAGKSMTSWHGQASFREVQFELLGQSRWVARHVRKLEAGLSVTYSDIRQPRSWFGHLYGDPNDSVRGEWAYLFLRRTFRDASTTQPYVELGSGPMWSNRRVPAATSRFNFHSQLGLGARFFANRSHPLFVVYRFSHISNLAFGPHNPGHSKRNPGWDVHSVMIGTRVRGFSRSR